MFRQILIDPPQRNLQCILWRQTTSEEVQEFQLNTVTYETRSAAWLSVRCLKQLALDHMDKFPRESNIILHDFFMDDLLTGGDTEEEVKEICDTIVLILKSGCFHLQKWASNSKVILAHLQQQNPKAVIKIGEGNKTKTLGLHWSCFDDNLCYSVTANCLSSVTKRTVLSDIAQIYDPLGLLGPCIVIGKIMMQKLWSLKLSWDEALPSDIDTQWRTFKSQLSFLNNVSIPRLVVLTDKYDIQIHGFCDASMLAYGACIYFRSVNRRGLVRVALVMSRVAPLKSLTIPRLELCGALLLAQLYAKVVSSINIRPSRVYLWSDSTICLSWIKTSPSKMNTFVQNRVS